MTQQGPTSVRSDRVGALRRLAQRSFRQKVGRFLVEGPQAVREAVAHRPDAVAEVFVAEDAPEPAGRIAADAAAAGLAVVRVPDPVLLAFTETVHPQGIAAVASFVDVTVSEALTAAGPVVLLDRVRDPGNAGTILRTADAAGAGAVVFGAGSVDPYNGKVVRSTAGSMFHLPFSVAAEPVEVLAAARSAGRTVLAASADGELPLPEVVQAGVLAQPHVWLFGSEADGLAPELVGLADHRVSVPLVGAAESLNLAAATAVCLFAASFTK